MSPHTEDPACRSVGITLEDVGPGRARLRMRVTEDMVNLHGVAHGGYVFLLADAAFAYACNSRNVRAVAAQASVVFLASARDGETLIAEAEEAASSGRSGVYNVTVTGEDGRAVAAFQGYSRTIGGAIVGDE